MIASTWAETTLQSTLAPGSDTLPFAAQRSADGKTLVLRMVVPGGASNTFTVSLAGGAAFAGPNLTVWTLSAASQNDDNPVGNPMAISPQRTQGSVAAGATSIQIGLAAYTVATVVAALA